MDREYYIVEVEAGATPPEGGMKVSFQPQFLISDGNRYWLTLAVWGYDPAATEEDADKEAGVAHIAQTFQALLPSDLTAVELSTVEQLADLTDQQTDH